MESNSWTRTASSYSTRSSTRPDAYHGEECEGEDDQKPEYICPFCAEDFDVLELCCHIDEEHAIETKNGVCPICNKKVRSELVRHLTMQHASLLKVQRRKRMRKGVSNFSSIVRKELKEGNLQSFLGGSSFVVPPSYSEPDPLVSSFMYNQSAIDQPPAVRPLSSIEASSVKESSVEDSADRNVECSKLSDEDLKEQAQRCEFVQGILLSTFIDYNL